jgi:hypothetical protein
MTLSKENLAMLQSYGRSFLGAAVALYLAGVTDPYLYLNAFIAAIAPVALRYLNKNDIAFGKISGKSTPEELAAEAVSLAKKVAKQDPKVKSASAPVAPAKKATKAPAKKSTAKKTTSK